MARSKAKKTKKRTASGQRAIIIVSGKNKKGRPGSTRMLKSAALAAQAESLTEKETRLVPDAKSQPLPPKQKVSRKKKKEQITEAAYCVPRFNAASCRRWPGGL